MKYLKKLSYNVVQWQMKKVVVTGILMTGLIFAFTYSAIAFLGWPIAFAFAVLDEHISEHKLANKK